MFKFVFFFTEIVLIFRHKISTRLNLQKKIYVQNENLNFFVLFKKHLSVKFRN